MCCLFGLIDYGHSLSKGERNRILTILSTACEVRGTDAAGIAYHSRGQLHIYKRPRPAHAHALEDSRGCLGGDGAHPHDYPGK